MIDPCLSDQPETLSETQNLDGGPWFSVNQLAEIIGEFSKETDHLRPGAWLWGHDKWVRSPS